MGGGCFLEVLVLCHSTCHYVFMETVCKQPKASGTYAPHKNKWQQRLNYLYVLNVHRYAFTPLMDDSDDEEIEEFIASTNFGISNTIAE